MHASVAAVLGQYDIVEANSYIKKNVSVKREFDN